MAILFNFKSLWRPHLVRINENVDSGGESKKEVAELDHNPSPQRLVGQLTIAGEVVRDDDDDVVDAGMIMNTILTFLNGKRYRQRWR